MKKLEFTFRGVNSKGQSIKPSNFDISDFREFVNDVEKLVFANDVRRDKTEPITIEYKEGSAKLVLVSGAMVAATAFAPFIADMQEIGDSYSLAPINPKRAEIISKWQRKAKHDLNINYEFKVDESIEPVLKISKDTKYEIPTDLLIEADLYIYGKLVDMGGKKKANVHIDTKEFGVIIATSSEAVLSSYPDNLVYQEVGVKLTALQNIKTGEFTNYEFVRFIPVEETDLEKFKREGTLAWKGKNAQEWINIIRNKR